MSLNDNTNKIAAILAAANALPDRLDTSDATASAEDIVKDKTAYVNGEKVTGSREKVTQLTGSVTSKIIQNGLARFIGKVTQNAAIDTGKIIGLSLGAEELGDANDADVAKGKTYTSAAGFKRTGTKEEAAAPSGSISITANGTYDVTDKASAVVNVPQSGGGSPYVTDLGDISFTHTQESIVVDSIGMTGTYDIYTSAEIEAPAELITAVDYIHSGNWENTYFLQNNLQIIFKEEEVGSTARMDIYLGLDSLFADFYYYNDVVHCMEVVPFYEGMLDTICSSRGELVSTFLINTHNSDSTIAEGKIKIELKLFGENIYYTKDYWFANSHILALHADWSLTQ